MFKSLKGKITCIYLFLVFTVAIVGVSSVLNFYRLSKSIDGLMGDNYKSINAARHMLEALENQDIALHSFIYTGNQTSIDNFYQGNDSFYKWYNVEANNITEPGEKNIVDKINEQYLKYHSQFSELQNIRATNGTAAAAQFYTNTAVSAYNALRIELKNLTELNEKAMFEGKKNVTSFAIDRMYIIMILSIVVIILGFVLSSVLTNKFLRPLYVLKENIKAIREGHLKQQTVVQSNDEIGSLAKEFNEMTIRLQQFEKSTKGMLLQERNKSVAIVKSISDPVIVLDTHYKIILINHACEIFFSVAEKEALNKHFLEVIRENEVFDHIIDAYTATEERHKHKPKIISLHLGSKEFFFDTIVTKVKDENFNVIGMVVVFQNITKLKKLEKTKTEYVSTISHELKTPLTSIMMGTSLIKNGDLGEMNTKQKEVIDIIEADTEKLSALVNDVIQLSKIESDRALFNFETCSVFGIVENCIKGFLDTAAKKELSLYSEVEETLPRIMADYEKISWVINNLILNAIKNTNAGDYIEVNAQVREGMMHISVKDSGGGIPEEFKDKIFDKFVKAHPFDAETKGTGLGLAIAKEIVEIHRGTIWCESALDEGSTFTFTVALAE